MLPLELNCCVINFLSLEQACVLSSASKSWRTVVNTWSCDTHPAIIRSLKDRINNPCAKHEGSHFNAYDREILTKRFDEAMNLFKTLPTNAAIKQYLVIKQALLDDARYACIAFRALKNDVTLFVPGIETSADFQTVDEGQGRTFLPVVTPQEKVIGMLSYSAEEVQGSRIMLGRRYAQELEEKLKTFKSERSSHISPGEVSPEDGSPSNRRPCTTS